MREDAREIASQVRRDGFALVARVLDHEIVARLNQAIAGAWAQEAVRSRGGSTYAIRNLMQVVPAVRAAAADPAILDLVEPVIGRGTFVTRAILFDKTPAANWKVGWHQDTSIAVEKQAEEPGFGPWSVKAGVVHVRPPVEVLERMLTVRLHLDDCDADNGALLVMPGSHREGYLEPDAVRSLHLRGMPAICETRAGGALLMRPLLLHASGPATRPAHRRVIHLEYACGELPGRLAWARA
jgi:ectoine hydroxylase-related dioxygenase (phytanoyl-CoA dioxygenase family)